MVRRLAPLVLVFAASGLAAAGDPVPVPAPPAPTDTYAAKVRTLPAPAAALGFDWACDLLMAGGPVGSATFRAAPTPIGDEGATGWAVEETIVLGSGPQAARKTWTATLDAQLRPLQGRVEGRNADETTKLRTWVATAEGFTVTDAQAADGAAPRAYAHQGPVMTGLAGLFLFCRLALPVEGAFAVTVLDADEDEPGRVLEMAEIDTRATGSWKDLGAWVATGSKADGTTFTVAFDAEGPVFLGARFTPGGKATVEVRPRIDEAEPEPDYYGDPAATPEQAALQAGLAFATGDVALIEKVLDWETLHAEEGDGEETLEAFKEGVLTRLASLEKRPRAMIEAAMGMVKAQLEVTGEGDTRVVTFPPLFQSLVVEVRKLADGTWKLRRLPRKPG